MPFYPFAGADKRIPVKGQLKIGLVPDEPMQVGPAPQLRVLWTKQGQRKMHFGRIGTIIKHLVAKSAHFVAVRKPEIKVPQGFLGV